VLLRRAKGSTSPIRVLFYSIRLLRRALLLARRRRLARPAFAAAPDGVLRIFGRPRGAAHNTLEIRRRARSSLSNYRAVCRRVPSRT